MNKNKMSKNNFKQAVESTPDTAKCYQTGLKPLGEYSKKVELTDKRKCQGSVDIDGYTKKSIQKLTDGIKRLAMMRKQFLSKFTPQITLR